MVLQPAPSSSIALTNMLLVGPEMSPSIMPKILAEPSGFQPWVFPAASSSKVFLFIKPGETSLPVMAFMVKEPDDVGPSITTFCGLIVCILTV